MRTRRPSGDLAGRAVPILRARRGVRRGRQPGERHVLHGATARRHRPAAARPEGAAGADGGAAPDGRGVRRRVQPLSARHGRRQAAGPALQGQALGAADHPARPVERRVRRQQGDRGGAAGTGHRRCEASGGGRGRHGGLRGPGRRGHGGLKDPGRQRHGGLKDAGRQGHGGLRDLPCDGRGVLSPGAQGLATAGVGSNGWALGRDATRTGNAMVLANPHLPGPSAASASTRCS